MQNPFEVIIERLENIERCLIEINSKEATRTPEADTLLTISEAARFLNLAVPTLYSKVSRQEIPSAKKGKRLYFSKDELTAWIKGGKKLTVAEIQANTDKHLVQIGKGKRA